MRTWAGVLAALLISGCASSVRIDVKTSAETNSGRPFYMMVRSVDGQSFLAEDYAAVADRLLTVPPDPTVRHRAAIIPGQPVSVVLPEGEEAEFALYFFFTEPGDKWRVPFARPVPAQITVELGRHDIKRVQIRKR